MRLMDKDRRFIVTIIIVFFLVFVTGYFYFAGINTKLARVEEYSMEKNEEIKVVTERLSKEALGFATLISENHDVIEAYKMENFGDIYLQKKINPIIEHLQTRLEMETIKVHFHKPPAISFLRVWHDTHGENLEHFRHTILKVYETGEALTGIEVGRGGFAFRGISPIFDGNEYLGSVEVFFEPKDLEERIVSTRHETLIFAIPNEVEEALFFETTTDEYGHIDMEGYSLYSSRDIFYHNHPEFVVWENLKKSADKRSPIIDHIKDHTISYIPLYDYSDVWIGNILLFVENSVSPSQNMLEYLLLFVSMVLAVLLVYFMNREISEKEKIESDQLIVIEELNIVKSDLEQLSIRDPLTSLLNRRGIETYLEDNYNRFSRYGVEFTVILCDLDKFKVINDQFGHDIGDKALIHVSKILENGLRRVDVVGRWGGDEFIIVVENSSECNVKLMAEKIRETIYSELLDVGKNSIRISLTMGIAKIKDNMSISKLITLADEALFEGKESGGNKIVEKK
jgi:diguanylate cyclase (GGDEF)-like protein